MGVQSTMAENPNIHVLSHDGLHFACYDVTAFQDAYREVFEEEVYRFHAKSDQPYIIDAGANLGLATCYFKKRYPQATVLAFEPDPRMGVLYQHNIRTNQLEGITFRQTALSGKTATVGYYGDLSTEAPHALGNSLREEWGRQRQDSARIEVESEILSPYLNREVDLLKMDIEGAEWEVLTEAAPHLHKVHEIRMEVHQTRSHPLLIRIETLLRDSGFDMRVEPRHLRQLLPHSALPWFQRERPEIFVLTAWRRE